MGGYQYINGANVTGYALAVTKAGAGISLNSAKITGLFSGAISSSSTEALNGSQLYTTATSAAEALGGGSTVNSDGAISAPTYSVGGTTVSNVGDAISRMDGRTTSNTEVINNIKNQINNGSIGLVQQDAATRKLTVGKNTDGTEVNFAGTAGNRVLTGVATGAVNAISVDVVNGSQLYTTSKSVADAIGGGSIVNSDGTISVPTYSVGGTTVSNVGDAIFRIDGRTTSNTEVINNIKNQINNGSIGLVQQDAATRKLTVGKNTDGTEVSFAGTAGNRVLTGVAAGMEGTDAVNLDQLNAATQSTNRYMKADGKNDGTDDASVTPGTSGVAFGAGSAAMAGNAVALGAYSIADHANTVSVGSAGNERQITNVAAGLQDTDAVNFKQLNDAYNDLGKFCTTVRRMCLQ
ncbi:hypothetical protein WK00_22390 [Burkholderia ubonensis]|nr:hypothetical protein WK00_22390 [Burkholderia ubonensis]